MRVADDVGGGRERASFGGLNLAARRGGGGDAGEGRPRRSEGKRRSARSLLAAGEPHVAGVLGGRRRGEESTRQKWRLFRIGGEGMMLQVRPRVTC